MAEHTRPVSGPSRAMTPEDFRALARELFHYMPGQPQVPERLSQLWYEGYAVGLRRAAELARECNERHGSTCGINFGQAECIAAACEAEAASLREPQEQPE